jgi:hypothetical protein
LLFIRHPPEKDAARSSFRRPSEVFSSEFFERQTCGQ